MTAIKPADADRLLARPDPAARLVLIYGNDDGLVAERAERFAAAVAKKDGGGDGDDLARVRLEAAALSDDPGRLADEAHAVPLFGGSRVVTVRGTPTRALENAVAALVETPPRDAWVVIAAGDLRKSSPLRKLAESSAAAWAVPCYADSARDLDRLIDDETQRAGLAIADDARAALKGLIGSDRLQSRAEVEKLCLYAAGGREIALADVSAVVGDSAAFAIDETVDHLAMGNAAELDRGYRRLVAAGTPGFVVAGAAQRHFNFLERARAAYDAGDGAEAIVRRAVPPVFFARQKTVAAAIERWPATRIERALAGLDQAVRDSRLHGAIADEVIGQALQLVAALAPRAPGVKR
jgi:DNA polymerase-3 subunit delta